MGLLDEIRKALEGEKKSEFIDQILKEKGLFDALHDAGYTIAVDDPQSRARQQPFGLLSTLHKIDLIDLITLITLIEEINTIHLIDRIALIDAITSIVSIGSMALVSRITQLDKIHPDPPVERINNGDFETGDTTGWEQYLASAEGYIVYAGVYSCEITCYSSEEGYIRQTFVGVLKSDIESFGYYQRTVGYGQYGIVTIEYSDASYTKVEIDTIGYTWEYVDLLPYVEDGKTVTGVKLSHNAVMSPYYYFDNISLMVIEAHTVIDKVKEIVSMPAVTGSVEVTGSQGQPLLQRASTYDLIVQLRSAGVEIDPRTIRLLTASDIVTVNNLLNPHPVSLASIPNPPNLDVALSTRALESGGNLAAILAQLDSKTSTLFKATQNIGNTSFGATQSTRTSLKVQPEREDIESLGGVASPSAAGVQIVAASGSLVPKVYDAEYEGLADGLHYFYFGTSTSPTTKTFLSRNTKGVNSKTFVQPRVGAAGDGIYLYSSVAETNMPYDLGYKLE